MTKDSFKKYFQVLKHQAFSLDRCKIGIPMAQKKYIYIYCKHELNDKATDDAKFEFFECINYQNKKDLKYVKF